MENIYGKSKAAEKLRILVEDDKKLHRKIHRFIIFSKNYFDAINYNCSKRVKRHLLKTIRDERINHINNVEAFKNIRSYLFNLISAMYKEKISSI